MLEDPSRKDYESMACSNLIANYPVNPDNISHACKPIGENLAGLRGKTVPKQTEPVVMDYAQIPRSKQTSM